MDVAGDWFLFNFNGNLIINMVELDSSAYGETASGLDYLQFKQLQSNEKGENEKLCKVTLGLERMSKGWDSKMEWLGKSESHDSHITPEVLGTSFIRKIDGSGTGQ